MNRLLTESVRQAGASDCQVTPWDSTRLLTLRRCSPGSVDSWADVESLLRARKWHSFTKSSSLAAIFWPLNHFRARVCDESCPARLPLGRFSAYDYVIASRFERHAAAHRQRIPYQIRERIPVRTRSVPTP